MQDAYVLCCVNRFVCVIYERSTGDSGVYATARHDNKHAHHAHPTLSAESPPRQTIRVPVSSDGVETTAAPLAGARSSSGSEYDCFGV